MLMESPVAKNTRRRRLDSDMADMAHLISIQASGMRIDETCC